MQQRSLRLLFQALFLLRLHGHTEDNRLTIFACPRPFSAAALASPSADAQLRAISSWLALKNAPSVVLFGKDSSLRAAAAQFPRVSVETAFDDNFLGVPLFHSLLRRSMYADTVLSAFVNSDVMLFDDIVDAAVRLSAQFGAFVATSARYDLETSLHMELVRDVTSGAIQFSARNGSLLSPAEYRELAVANGRLHSYGGTDVWLWNNKRSADGEPVPLHDGPTPAFTYGRGVYDNWLNHEIEVSRARVLVDTTLAATALHQEHSHDHVAVGGAPTGRRALANFWSNHKRSSWEMFANTVLANTHGTYVLQKGTSLHATWRLARCEEPLLKNMCFSKRIRPAACSCEYSSSVAHSDTDPLLRKGVFTCGTTSVTNMSEYVISGHVNPSTDVQVGLPHTLEQLLKTVPGSTKTVVLTGLLGNYLHLLMNFVCQLRKLGVRNLLVAAFDEVAYREAFLHGLPVFFASAPGAAGSVSCRFGTACFRAVTKAKSRATLAVLKAGFNVLFSDVDVMWFENPLAQLQSTAEELNALLVQSNEPDKLEPANGHRRVNSGFYFALANEPTISALQTIVAHESRSEPSEQPSFNEVLCGVDGSFRDGTDACQMPGGLRTVFLDRDAYPNGKHNDLWEAPDVIDNARRMGAKILHNNWIVGSASKLRRQKLWWHYDDDLMMCVYNWAARPGPQVHATFGV